ncbi:MAG: copper amine oxidase N-terminal domain-containing protein, partial [Candidatus Eremiobacteraeota bacterium]|nr:copper amine oxidase N-terminal domain-containing protein [Candidatus Eremiobacteraeota bacterium]
DGQPQTIDVAPFIVGATTFVPLRFISQALGASVNWNDSTSTVTIQGGPPPAAAPPPGAVRFVSVSPTGTIYNPTPLLRFQFDRPVRVEGCRVWIDGRNVTLGLRQVGPASFTVAVPAALGYGSHRVRVTGVTAGGASFELFWTFVRG